MKNEFIKHRVASANNYAEYEYRLTKEKIIPFLSDWDIKLDGLTLIDVGCGAGGTTQVFYENGAKTTGIDISSERIDIAKERVNNHNQKIDFFCFDAHKSRPELENKFELAIVRDVIEHIADPRVFLLQINKFLEPSGRIFISFPPYFSAFGGHQHHPNSVTRFFPWIHLLLKSNYIKLLPKIPEYRAEIKALNHLTIYNFEKILQEEKFQILKKEYYIIRPSLNFKYGLPLMKAGFIGKMKHLRELLVTGAFYLLKPSIL